MEEDFNEEFFESSNLSENEYYDAESQNDSCDTFNYWYDEIQCWSAFKHCFSDENVNPPAILKNGISSLIDPSKLNYGNSGKDKIRDVGKFNRNKKETNDVMKKSAEILEAILNEVSLEKINSKDECIPKDGVDFNRDSVKDNKINICDYIDSNPHNGITEAPNILDQFTREDEKLNTIEKEVQELELEIEKMFNSNSTQKLKIEHTSSYGKCSSDEDSNVNIHTPISNEKKMSTLPSRPTYSGTSQNINQIFSISGDEYVSNYTKAELGKCSSNGKFLSTSIPSSESRSTLEQCSESGINQSETESSTESEEIVTLMESSKAAPVHSVELIPKLLEEQRNSHINRISMVRNILKTKTLLENSKLCGMKRTENCNSRKKYSKPKSPQVFKKVRSLIVNTDGSKRMNKNSSKSFHTDRSNSQNISNVDQLKTHINMKVTGKMQISEKKLKIKDSKKIRNEKHNINEPKKSNKAVNTRKVTRRNFSCQKAGTFIDSTNFCSISLHLESAYMNFAKEKLMKSMKEYFWRTESTKERTLLQLVILCMANNFQEISITNEKFRLHCQNEFSFTKNDMNFEEAGDNKNSFKSNLICQPLYIETITSQSHVNRLALE